MSIQHYLCFLFICWNSLASEYWMDDVAYDPANFGAGTESDPYRVGGYCSATGFDAVMTDLMATNGPVTIRLQPGTYFTHSQNFSNPLWLLKAGTQIIGNGSGWNRPTIRRCNLHDDQSIHDLSYVLFGDINANDILIENLFIDCNYTTNFPRTSCAGINIRGGGTVRGVTINNVSGNTDENNGGAEMYGLRVSGQFSSDNYDINRNASILIENCAVVIVKGGYISGIMPGAGTGAVRSNIVVAPLWHVTESDNPYNVARGINVTAANGMVIHDNVTSGGRTALYSDFREIDDLSIFNNDFNECVSGIHIHRGDHTNSQSAFTHDVTGVEIYNNMIRHMTNATGATNVGGWDQGTGIKIQDHIDFDLPSPRTPGKISYILIEDNIITGGDWWNFNGTTSMSIQLMNIDNVICHSNRADKVYGTQVRAYWYTNLTGSSYFYSLLDEEDNEVLTSWPSGVPWIEP